MLPSGIIAGRQGGYVAYRPFHVLGVACGGLVGGVADAARLAMLHLNDGILDEARVLPADLAVRMRQVTRAAVRWNDHEANLAAVARTTADKDR